MLVCMAVRIRGWLLLISIFKPISSVMDAIRAAHVVQCAVR